MTQVALMDGRKSIWTIENKPLPRRWWQLWQFNSWWICKNGHLYAGPFVSLSLAKDILYSILSEARNDPNR